MSGNPRDDFESLARRYWAAWGDALRGAVPGEGKGSGTGAGSGMGGFAGMAGLPGMAGFPGMGAFPGMGGPQVSPPGADAWQQSMDWWTRLAQGGRSEANDALAHFNSQASRWYGHMQEVAARFAGQDASAGDVARAWKEALGAGGANPFPEMLRSMRGHGLQGLEQWFDEASPWLDAMRGEGMSWLRMPAFGAGREQQERLQALAAHMDEYRRASDAYAALMLQAQQDAFVIFENRLAAHEEPGRQIGSARALFDLWIEAAEEAYAAIALSPRFREVYGRLVNAQMRVRAGVQRMVEDACAQFGMPTRSELDGAHRKLAQLEREVRRLRDAAANGVGASRAPAARQPVGRTAARRAPARASEAAAKPATKRAAETGQRSRAKPAKTVKTAKTAKTGKTAGTARTASKRTAKNPVRKTAKSVAAKRAAPAARKTGGRSSAGRSFGGAIAGAMPQAPAPIASDPLKKSVKKGKR